MLPVSPSVLSALPARSHLQNCFKHSVKHSIAEVIGLRIHEGIEFPAAEGCVKEMRSEEEDGNTGWGRGSQRRHHVLMNVIHLSWRVDRSLKWTMTVQFKSVCLQHVVILSMHVVTVGRKTPLTGRKGYVQFASFSEIQDFFTFVLSTN